MNLDKIKYQLKKEFNCELINIFQYENTNFIKGIELLEHGIRYRYFKVDNNKIQEIVDKMILEYFKENKENNSEIIY